MPIFILVVAAVLAGIKLAGLAVVSWWLIAGLVALAVLFPFAVALFLALAALIVGIVANLVGAIDNLVRGR